MGKRSTATLEKPDPVPKTIGDILRETRDLKGVSISKVAASTRMKVQHVEAMENNDFGQFAAATYARGFLKLYAQYLGLDPKPLIDQYIAQHAPNDRASLMNEDARREPRRRRPGSIWSRIPWQKIKLSRDQLLVAGKGLAFVAALLVLGSMMRRCGGAAHDERTAQAPIARAPRTAALIMEPPEPYLDVDLISE